MEWGARALGNRSIIADGRDPDVIVQINEAIKNRDFWMPFHRAFYMKELMIILIILKNFMDLIWLWLFLQNH